MQIVKLPYEQIPGFSARDKAYLAASPALRPFYKYEVGWESFALVMADKRHDKTDRQTLVRVLWSQHEKFSPHPSVVANIDNLLKDNAFTVVTAHQPSLFTGPLYYIFKIISTINLANELAKRHPECHFVPVFITSGEDHDFEEVNHLHLFNKKLAWETTAKGAVGMMRTESLQPVLTELKGILGDSPAAADLFQLLERTHTRHDWYADAAFELAHELFKDRGLVVLNTNDARLKALFAPIIKDEILRQSSYPIVNETIARLELAGFSAQAAPREINFFYLGEQLRERIVQEDGVFKVLNTNLLFSPEQMEAEIEQHPERFSPNVVMRPLMQELILPNLAYVGGGGELAYWLERKAQFEHFGLNFPMLIRRNSAMWIDAGTEKRMEKLGLSLDDLWLDTEALIRHFLHKNAEAPFQLEDEKTALKAVFEKIATKTEAIDPTLVKSAWAVHAQSENALSQLETKLVRAEKQRHENALQQIRSLKEKLFPGNGLQERFDNFIPFFLKYGSDFFDALSANFDVMEKKFVVFREG